MKMAVLDCLCGMHWLAKPYNLVSFLLYQQQMQLEWQRLMDVLVTMVLMVVDLVVQ
jgi:hypothetical protein